MTANPKDGGLSDGYIGLQTNRTGAIKFTSAKKRR